MTDKFLKNITKNNQYQHYLNELQKELGTSSDRGIVLTCGSIMDALLGDILKSFLVQSDQVDKDLFTVNGALGTFDSKIKMAYYLGLISKYEVDNLTYLQRVRNRFAHQIINISFENNDIANICRNFKIPKNGFVPLQTPFPDKQPGELPTLDLNPIKKDTSAKDRFIYTFYYLYVNFGIRINDNLGKRKEFDIIYTADMTITKTTQLYEETLKEYRSVLNDYHAILEKETKSLENLKKLRDPNTDEIAKKEEKVTKIKEIIADGEEYFENVKKYTDPAIKLSQYVLEVIEKSIID